MDGGGGESDDGGIGFDVDDGDLQVLEPSNDRYVGAVCVWWWRGLSYRVRCVCLWWCGG